MSAVIWITGFSGSGKTTLADALSNYFSKNKKNVIRLDGDELRKILCSEDFIDKDAYAFLKNILTELIKSSSVEMFLQSPH